MGVCFGSSDEQTREIDSQLNNDKRAEQDVIKLLFLGAGGSGKSTLFKQLRLLHGRGFQNSDRQMFFQNVHKNIIENMKVLVSSLKMVADDEDDDSKIPDEVEKAMTTIEDTDATTLITAENKEPFEVVWNSEVAQEQWLDRSNLQIQDSLAYFMEKENFDRIVAPQYCPSTDDVLHVRARTTGIVEETFDITGRNFLIVDVGGQRSERKKWIKCFDEVTGIIYVVSLSGYDQYLSEDDSVLRMNESLHVFRDLNSKHLETFKETMMILFLNKSDLFKEKIKHHPISICFPKYTGKPDDVDESYEYIKNQYMIQNKNPSTKIFVHRTCATDTSQMKHIFDAVNHTIINRALIKAGLLVPDYRG